MTEDNSHFRRIVGKDGKPDRFYRGAEEISEAEYVEAMGWALPEYPVLVPAGYLPGVV